MDLTAVPTHVDSDRRYHAQRAPHTSAPQRRTPTKLPSLNRMAELCTFYFVGGAVAGITYDYTCAGTSGRLEVDTADCASGPKEPPDVQFARDCSCAAAMTVPREVIVSCIQRVCPPQASAFSSAEQARCRASSTAAVRSTSHTSAVPSSAKSTSIHTTLLSISSAKSLSSTSDQIPSASALKLDPPTSPSDPASILPITSASNTTIPIPLLTSTEPPRSVLDSPSGSSSRVSSGILTLRSSLWTPSPASTLSSDTGAADGTPTSTLDSSNGAPVSRHSIPLLAIVLPISLTLVAAAAGVLLCIRRRRFSNARHLRARSAGSTNEDRPGASGSHLNRTEDVLSGARGSSQNPDAIRGGLTPSFPTPNASALPGPRCDAEKGGSSDSPQDLAQPLAEIDTSHLTPHPPLDSPTPRLPATSRPLISSYQSLTLGSTPSPSTHSLSVHSATPLLRSSTGNITDTDSRTSSGVVEPQDTTTSTPDTAGDRVVVLLERLLAAVYSTRPLDGVEGGVSGDVPETLPAYEPRRD
ncbi:hypothetical protein C8Q77DRAFT_1148710 [Trametes polyzona]|nr:hypothetical protein C8Q77DRAFT_1148710 [Trametes polyzona]